MGSKQKKEDAQIVNRDKKIIRTSIIGIIANVFLAAFKAAVGLFSNSIAIVLDAVNNISDAASSIITIIGTFLAGKAPDKKHPFGHGRAEYLTATVISMLVTYAGITSMIESVKKIITPQKPDYSAVSLVIIAVAVIVKIVLGTYVKGVGKKVNSASLVNSGSDAMLDSVISASTLIAAVVFIETGISLEAWLGAVISAVIIKSGIDMLRGAISSLLGERADASLAKKIKATVCSFEDVFGAYDLVLNDYGPDTFLGSVHIEIPDTYSANELDDLTREITEKVLKEHNVILTAIGIYSINTSDNDVVRAREQIEKALLENEYVLQIHGFYFSEERKKIRFDAVVSFKADREEIYSYIVSRVGKIYPDYDVQVVLDLDFSD